MGLLRKTPALTYVPAVAARAGREEFVVCPTPPPGDPPVTTPPITPPDDSAAPRVCYTVPAGLVCRPTGRTNPLTGQPEYDCYVVGAQEVCFG